MQRSVQRPDTSTTVTLAVIGDIHDHWELIDNAALEHLGVDIALFLGDYGNESVEIVRRIAAVNVPKAAVMGNHDAYYSASNKGIQKCPYDREKEDWVQLQMDLLGADHVGFSKKEFPQFGLTIVGARPFSWGGSKWRYKKFYRDRFDIRSFNDSAELILAAADEAEQNTIIFMGHVGPYGLGAAPHDPCGKDWGKHGSGGDYGDPDFADAIALTQQSGKNIPLVTFGHMHHKVKNSEKIRKRVAVGPTGTLYFNAANVPRIESTEQGDRRSFSLVKLQNNAITSIELVWLNAEFQTLSQETLYPSQIAVDENRTNRLL